MANIDFNTVMALAGPTEESENVLREIADVVCSIKCMWDTTLQESACEVLLAAVDSILEEAEAENHRRREAHRIAMVNHHAAVAGGEA